VNKAPRKNVDESPLRWIDVTGYDRSKLERVRKRLDLPSRFVPLSRARFLYPTLLDVPPACLLATFFTTPAARRVFRTEPLTIWVTEDAIITLTPKLCINKTFPSVLEGTSDNCFLSRLLDAVVASHEDVVQGLNGTSLASRAQRGRCRSHQKECRVRLLARLLERQTSFFAALGEQLVSVQALRARLNGLRQVMRHASERLHGAAAQCPSCGHETRMRL
jgi:hypothetical protein